MVIELLFTALLILGVHYFLQYALRLFVDWKLRDLKMNYLTLDLKEAHLLRQWFQSINSCHNPEFMERLDCDLYGRLMRYIADNDDGYRQTAMRDLEILQSKPKLSQKEFLLPMPPSINGYYRSPNKGPLAGRVMISEDGRAYRKAVKDAVLVQRVKHVAGRLSLEIVLCFGRNGKADLDNRVKCLQDALQHAGVFEDDSQIDLLIVRRGPVTKGGLVQVCLGVISG